MLEQLHCFWFFAKWIQCTGNLETSPSSNRCMKD